jgi:hypothetical protein
MSSLQRSGQDVLVRNRHRISSGGFLLVLLVITLRAFQSIWNREALEDVINHPGGWIGAAIVVALSAIVMNRFTQSGLEFSVIYPGD